MIFKVFKFTYDLNITIIDSMNDLAYCYTISDKKTICIHRVYGMYPTLCIPDEINGYPVTQIADYCFAQRQKMPEDVLFYGEKEEKYELSGKLVEEIILPDSIEKLGSFVFYGCTKLKSISFPKNLKEIGSDDFINCLSLHTLYYRTHMEAGTILKQILTQIAWDIDVVFENGIVFFPEYYEVYDEIGPAHIFGLQISGEGFRMRQCFEDGKLQLDQVDKIFEKLCVEESFSTLAHFSLVRFLNHRKEYHVYIQQNQRKLVKWMTQESQWSQDFIISVLETMKKEDCLHTDTLNYVLKYSQEKQWPQLSALCIGWKQEKKRQKTYNFEDF